MGRNDGAGLYLLESLKLMPDVFPMHFVPEGDVREFGDFDLHIWIDHGEDSWITQNYPCPKPNLYWVSDMHWSQQAKDFRIAKAKEFDVVCCNHPHQVQWMKQELDPDRVFWVPFAVHPPAYPYEQAIKKYDLCFIGHLNTMRRIEALDAMFKAFPSSFYGRKFFEKAARVYQESKICFNECVAKDVNMRSFEIMGSGGFLLTERCDGMMMLFQDGKHCVMFDTIEEAIEKAKYYIEHDDEREAIAKAGYEEVMARHTYLHRAQQLLQIGLRQPVPA